MTENRLQPGDLLPHFILNDENHQPVDISLLKVVPGISLQLRYVTAFDQVLFSVWFIEYVHNICS